jgi:putative membrane protein
MTMLLRWVINALALLLVTQVVPGFAVDGVYYAFIGAFVLGLLNAVIRPILIFFTLPINVLTLGLFTFVINALLIWFVSTFLKGFTVEGFLPALLAAIILWAVSYSTNWLIKQSKEKKK